MVSTGHAVSVRGGLILSLVAGLLVGLPPVPVVAAEPVFVEPSVPVSPVEPAGVSAPAMTSWRPPVVVWPSAGSATVDVSDGSAAASASGGVVVGGVVSPGGLSVRVAAPVSGSMQVYEQRLMRGLPAAMPSMSAASLVAVSTLDQMSAAGLGVDGVLLTVGNAAAALMSAAPVEVTVDYSSFGHAYGGGYADRLRLVWLPACALTTPSLRECQAQTPVAGGRNDRASATVSGRVDLFSGPVPVPGSSAETAAREGVSPDVSEGSGGLVVLAVTAGSSSEQGDWGATSLSQAASWAAGASGGDFSYSIPVSVPSAPGGLMPTVSLSYSSGSVDGLTKSTSSQASWVGEGWDFHPGFVERSYRSCKEDGQWSYIRDLCWVSESPVTVVLNGTSTRLFRNDADGVWKAEDDSAGWKVERLTGLVNGARLGEAFKITTRDGTQYWFGSRHAVSLGGVLSVPVFGNHVGEPCHHPNGFAWSVCNMPYRWNLDRVQDVHGNVIDLQWHTFRGNYGSNNNSRAMVYDITARLDTMLYGANLNAGEPGVQYTGKVVFESGDRCLVADCNPNVNWPDTPWDQYCHLNQTSCPGQTAPTFWTKFRLKSISTFVWDTAAGAWSAPVGTTTFAHMFPATPDQIPPAGNDTSPALWLSHVTQPGMPTMTLSGQFMRNRVDWGCCNDAGQQIPPMNRIRLNHINTGHGEAINVAYTGEDCQYYSLPPAADNNNRRCFPQIDETGDLSWWHKYVVTDVWTQDAFAAGGPDERWHYDYSWNGTSTLALWKYDQAWHTPPARRSWTRWAGYPTVHHWHGNYDGTGPRLSTETLFHRGMDGDKTAAGGWNSRRSTLDDSWDHAVVDHVGLAGTVGARSCVMVRVGRGPARSVSTMR